MFILNNLFKNTSHPTPTTRTCIYHYSLSMSFETIRMHNIWIKSRLFQKKKNV